MHKFGLQTDLPSVIQSVLAMSFPMVNPRKLTMSIEQAAEAQPIACDINIIHRIDLFTAYSSQMQPERALAGLACELLLAALISTVYVTKHWSSRAAFLAASPAKDPA